MSGIYFHIPFCRQACNYCDFHFSTRLENKERVLKAMNLELNQRVSYLNTKTISSIYFGGGTPSLLNELELGELMKSVFLHYTVKTNAEITLEANPEDINTQSLQIWKNVGINRLSIGLQSFNEEELRWMKRNHSGKDSVQAVKLAQQSGFDNISIDLIYGSKFQDLGTWSDTLEQAIALKTNHISSYNLTIENKTELGVKNKRGQEPEIDEHLSVAQFELMRKRLSAAGFVHYEVSNFAKPGYEAKHNSSYWQQNSYLGIGPSAHSFNQISRQWNFSNNLRYCKAIEEGTCHYEMEVLSKNDRYNEYVLTGLRTTKGCNINYMSAAFGEKVKIHFVEHAAEKHEYFDIKNENYTLNEKGLLQADAIASALFLI